MLNYDTIKEKVSCFDLLSSEGISVSGNRCAAEWRGGENKTSVTISDDGKSFCDFARGNKGGSVLDLAAEILNTPGDIFGAAIWLNNKFNCCEIKKEENLNIIKLRERGYTKLEEYEYTDATGKLAHVKEKWVKKGEKNTFLQRNSKGQYTLKDTETYLFRLPEIIPSECVIVAEGEKDVNNIFKLGYAATTATSTSLWEDSYTEVLAGKHICIAEDNDEAGRTRTEKLKIKLKNAVASIRLIRFENEAKGFDVTDYIEKYGADAFINLIKTTPAINIESIDDSATNKAIIEAKEANKHELANYTVLMQDNTASYIPRKPSDIYEDVKRRFLGFPYRMGEKLFDIDKDTRNLIEIRDSTALFSWMWNKSDNHIDWRQGSKFMNKKEFFVYITQKTKEYNQVIYAPTFPEHESNFRGYPDLPEPDEEHKYFNHWVDFFNPVDDLNKLLLKALFASPLYYEPEEKRPLWIIDSVSGAGVGKTTVAEQVAQLYRTKPMITNKQELTKNFEELTKKLLSTSGRNARVVLIDNVIGKFDCDRLSDLVTQSYVSGKPAYGHGEETRPNNLTYIITANSATIGNDISIRSIPIHFKAPKGGYNPKWLKDVIYYRETYRYHIFADMLDIIKNNETFPELENKSFIRFPRFEKLILQPFCGDLSEYYDLVKMIQAQKDENNLDKENAAEFEDRVKQGLRELNRYEEEPSFISRKVLKAWFNDIFDGKTYPIQAIDNWYKQGFFTYIQTGTNKRYNNERGLFFCCDNARDCKYFAVKVEKKYS